MGSPLYYTIQKGKYDRVFINHTNMFFVCLFVGDGKPKAANCNYTTDVYPNWSPLSRPSSTPVLCVQCELSRLHSVRGARDLHRGSGRGGSCTVCGAGHHHS